MNATTSCVSLVYFQQLARTGSTTVVLTFVFAVICILQNFIFQTMGPKKVSVLDGTDKKRGMVLTELKKENNRKT